MPCVPLVTRDPSAETLAERPLSASGHEAVSARSTDAAIRSLFKVRIHAAVVDSAVGEQLLREFCSRIRSGNDNYPIALLTAARASRL